MDIFYQKEYNKKSKEAILMSNELDFPKDKPIMNSEVKDGEELVETLKSSVTLAMTDWEQRFIGITFPTREDFETEEEYKETIVYMMTELVDSVRELKGDLFRQMNDNYNEFLAVQMKTNQDAKEDIKKAYIVMEKTRKDAKSSGIITIALTLLFPGYLPIIVLVQAPRFAYYLTMNLYSKHKVRNDEEIMENLRTIQIPYFDFICDMRSDYHKSNQELDELMKRAQQGEDVTNELLEMIKPERLSLSRKKAQELADREKIKEKKDDH